MSEEYLQKTIKRYNEIYQLYSEKWYRIDPSDVVYMKKFMKLVRGRKILDAACGCGRDSDFFQQNGFKVVGVDLSEKMISNAKKRNSNVLYVVADIRELPFGDNSFDGIWSVATLTHLDSEGKESAIREFYRVLRHEGILYISVHNFLYLPRFFKVMRLYALRKSRKIKDGVLYDGRYWYFPTLTEIKKLLERQNFEILESTCPFEKRIRIFAKKL